MTTSAALIFAFLTVWIRPSGEPILIRHARAAGGLRYVQRVDSALDTAARRYGVPPALLKALARHESGYRSVETPHGVGVLQVNPRQRLAVGGRCCTPDVPGCLQWQADTGAHLLRVALERCGDEWSALGQYRFGWQCIRRNRERQILRTRLAFVDAACRGEDAAELSLSSTCANRARLRAEMKGKGT